MTNPQALNIALDATYTALQRPPLPDADVRVECGVCHEAVPYTRARLVRHATLIDCHIVDDGPCFACRQEAKPFYVCAWCEAERPQEMEIVDA